MAKAKKGPKKPPVHLTYGQGELAGGVMRMLPPVKPDGHMPPPGTLFADVWVKSGMWVEVASSNVAAIAYDDREQILHVMFQTKSGVPPIWVYRGVDPQKAKDMFNCNSMGSFVSQRLKGKHSERKVR